MQSPRIIIRAVERSTQPKSKVLDDAPKHVRPCMHACTCMHTCLHEENEEGSLQRVQVYSESSRKQFLGACRQCRVHAEPSARVTKEYSSSTRNRNRANRNHLEICLSSSQKNRNRLTWVLVALPVCFTYPVLYRVWAESRAGE